MRNEIKRICLNCKNSESTDSPLPEDCGGAPFTVVKCKKYDLLKFPMGSVPTCNKWEEKDPTLQELRDEIRELKNRCRNDCCKCKRRCDCPPQPYQYWYPYNTVEPAPITYISDPYPSTTGTMNISSGSTLDTNYTWK